MNYWVLAFVGDDRRENREATQRTGTFYVSSNRTPMRRAKPGDQVLFYVAGEGFVAEAKISSPARNPYGRVEWRSQKPPLWGISVSDIRTFSSPIPYGFPGKGEHPVLGFHRYSLTGGFLAVTCEGFEDVLGWADTSHKPPTEDPPMRRATLSSTAGEESATRDRRVHKESRNSAARTVVEGGPDLREREKRAAGQHAVGEGRKRAALWTVAEIGGSAFKLKGVERFARGKAREAERTWLAGKAEERVGAELEQLREHGFYLFHDVPLAGIGNVDHAVFGEKGFYVIETKSHKGRVTAREGKLLVNGRHPEKDFVKQTWRGCYRLREVLGAEVTPILLFTEAFVEGRLLVRGVRVLPLSWLVEEILSARKRHDCQEVKAAVNAVGAASGCYPSAVPRLG